MRQRPADSSVQTTSRRDVTRVAEHCDIRQRLLDEPSGPTSLNCGGTCRQCMAEADDPGCVATMRELGLPFDERMADLSTEGHMTTLQEFTDVVLVKPYQRDKLLLPAGAKGTVLTVHPEFMS